MERMSFCMLIIRRPSALRLIHGSQMHNWVFLTSVSKNNLVVVSELAAVTSWDTININLRLCLILFIIYCTGPHLFDICDMMSLWPSFLHYLYVKVQGYEPWNVTRANHNSCIIEIWVQQTMNMIFWPSTIVVQKIASRKWVWMGSMEHNIKELTFRSTR